MATLFGTYAAAWAAVAAYVARLALTNRRLSQRLDELEKSVGSQTGRESSSQRRAG
jgi:CcmD family protein